MNIFDKLRAELISANAGLDLRIDVPMSEHTSFRIGGPAALMAFPKSREEFLLCIKAASALSVEPFVLGRGSNVLADDGRIERFVVKTFPALSGVVLTDDCTIRADCGAVLAKAANFALQNGLGGFEFAHGIPGTIGGAVRMNAGAFGGEIKDVLVTTEYCDRSGNVLTLENAEHDFSHRHSVFSDNGGYVLSAVIRLHPDDRTAIKARMDDFASRRLKSQPLDKPSAGSSFKRPENGYASAMIDQCGLKGLTVGGAAVSEKHAGFIVNLGGASAADVTDLMELVKVRVYDKFGVMLEPEIERLTSGASEV